MRHLRRARAHLGDGHVEVEAKVEDHTRDENDEDGEGGVLKVGHLDLHRAELDAPANVGRARLRVEPLGRGGRRLPANRLPAAAGGGRRVRVRAPVRRPAAQGEGEGSRGLAGERQGEGQWQVVGGSAGVS
eukprot:6950315-Prymnesium_polylepis.2